MFRRKSKSSLKDEDGTTASYASSSGESSSGRKGAKKAAPASRNASSASSSSNPRSPNAHYQETSLCNGLNASVLSEQNSRRIVVAIDFGTTYSGYAYAFRRKPDEIYLMRRKEAGQVGGLSHKIPTILLMDEREQFHAFGYEARDAYHDMTEEESRNWLYFEKFKMELHSRKVG